MDEYPIEAPKLSMANDQQKQALHATLWFAAGITAFYFFVWKKI